jgi:hypothetical protein
VIDRAKLHAFVDRMCDEIEAKGDWVSIPAYPGAKRAILTACQEEKLKALKGDTSALSLVEGITYRIGNYLLFHAGEFVMTGQLTLMDKGRRVETKHDVELVWDGKEPVTTL